MARTSLRCRMRCHLRFACEPQKATALSASSGRRRHSPPLQCTIPRTQHKMEDDWRKADWLIVAYKYSQKVCTRAKKRRLGGEHGAPYTTGETASAQMRLQPRRRVARGQTISETAFRSLSEATPPIGGALLAPPGVPRVALRRAHPQPRTWALTRSPRARSATPPAHRPHQAEGGRSML